MRLGGGYSGDFARVLASLDAANRADVVFSTVDTVGIPLALLGRLGRVRRPVVYAAIGLPERLAQLRGAPARRLFEHAFGKLHTIVAYGWGEVEELRRWLGEGGPRVEFVAFGVDVEHFRPDRTRARGRRRRLRRAPTLGATSRSSSSSRAGSRAARFGSSRLPTTRGSSALSPANVELETDVPFARVRECLLGGRVVVLPVRENSYSGATTTLLQAMACAKPVVVTRTAAIARGYHLEDEVNCRLVPPGDLARLEQAVTGVLDDDGRADALGRNARETVERHLTWSTYTNELGRLLADAAAAR